MAAEDKQPNVGEEAAEQVAPAVAGTEADAPEAAEAVEAGVIEDAPEDEDNAPADSGDSESAAGDQPDIFTAIKQEVTDLRDKYARLQAEWDNYRKRTATERDSERKRAAEKLVTDLLPVLDDLERAIKHAKESGEGGNLTEGVEAIQSKFLQILGKYYVQQIKAEGEPFDAMKHQAVGTQEDASVPEETVVQVYQQGYEMGDRVIRPAMVVTSVGGPARPAAPDGDEQDK